MQNETTLATPVWLRRFTKLTAASTLFLIFAGAMVTSTSSGLSVPDWPLSYGMLFPPMVGGIFYEHGHRMIASTVGLLTLIQAFWLQFREPKRFVRVLGWLALAAVVVQGVLGGLTVLFLLPLPISVGHASLAEVFYCIALSIAFFTSRFAMNLERGSSNAGVAGFSRFLVGALFVQIVIGALMRHLGAGLAIPDFPLAFGKVIPEFTSFAIVANFAHRAWGIIVACIVLGFGPSVMTKTRGALRGIYGTLLVAIAVQILFGALTVLSAKAPVVTSVHVVTGAFVLGTALVFALTANIVEQRSSARVGVAKEAAA